MGKQSLPCSVGRSKTNAGLIQMLGELIKNDPRFEGGSILENETFHYSVLPNFSKIEIVKWLFEYPAPEYEKAMVLHLLESSDYYNQL